MLWEQEMDGVFPPQKGWDCHAINWLVAAVLLLQAPNQKARI